MNIELIKGSQLKILLKRKGIMSKDITETFNLNKTTVSRYFTDDMQMPASFIIKVAAYAGLSLEDLIEGDIYQIIDMSDDVAAEPQVPYIAAPTQKELPPPDDIPTSDLVKVDVDVSKLTDIIVDLRKQIDNVEQTVMDLKEGKFSVNQ
jgi:transcriptional regulator with XRE-family HTH domain